MKEKGFISYKNDAFQTANEVVGWVDIGTSSRPVTRPVVGRVLRGVEILPDGQEKIRVDTFVKSYKGDYPLSLLGGSLSSETESQQEIQLSSLLSREYASSLIYSEFTCDPEVLFPDRELFILPPAELKSPTPQPIAA